MFDYFYQSETEQYLFYSIPQLLFTDEKFKKLSCEAKVLYGLFLDRSGLSAKKDWIDKKGRVYIYFKNTEIQDMLGCQSQKAVKIMKELDVATGIGLIERVKQGQGKPDRIYVKHFNRLMNDNDNSVSSLSTTKKVFKTEQITEQIAEDFDSNFKNSENHNSSDQPQSLNFENHNPSVSEITTQELRKSQSILYNHTKISILSNPSLSNQSYDEPNHKSQPVVTEEIDRIDMDRYTQCKEMIYSNIDYEDLIAQNADEQNKIDEIVENMLEMLCCTAPVIKISGKDISTKIVHSRLSKIDSSHIEYILICLKRNTTKVRNIKAYLRAVIYNAPSTMDSFYGAEVNNALSSPKLE